MRIQAIEISFMYYQRCMFCIMLRQKCDDLESNSKMSRHIIHMFMSNRHRPVSEMALYIVVRINL